MAGSFWLCSSTSSVVLVLKPAPCTFETMMVPEPPCLLTEEEIARMFQLLQSNDRLSVPAMKHCCQAGWVYGDACASRQRQEVTQAEPYSGWFPCVYMHASGALFFVLCKPRLESYCKRPRETHISRLRALPAPAPPPPPFPPPQMQPDDVPEKPEKERKIEREPEEEPEADEIHEC